MRQEQVQDLWAANSCTVVTQIKYFIGNRIKRNKIAGREMDTKLSKYAV